MRYEEWLVSEIGFQTQYHNHKETMAWFATALFVPGIIVLALELHSNDLNFWLVPIVAYFLVMLFVSWQFRMRSKSADTVVALRELFLNYRQDISDEERKIESGKHWPIFVENRIKDKKGQGRSWLDNLLSDGVPYTAITLATYTALKIYHTDCYGYIILDAVAAVFLSYLLVIYIWKK